MHRRRSALESGIDIIELLDRKPHAMRLTDIADQTRQSKSGAHKILTTLCSRGWVEHTQARTYKIKRQGASQ